MKILTTLLAAATLTLLSPAMARADAMTIDFTTKQGPVTVKSVGSLTLSLNDDGTVLAQLRTAADQPWFGIGFDTSTKWKATNLPQQASSSGWYTSSFGNFESGLFCNGCVGSASWTMTSDEKIASVGDMLRGGHSAYDSLFLTGDFLTGNHIGYAGMARAAATAVPEPASWAMMILGFGVIGAALRRRPSSLRATVRIA